MPHFNIELQLDCDLTEEQLRAYINDMFQEGVTYETPNGEQFDVKDVIIFDLTEVDRGA